MFSSPSVKSLTSFLITPPASNFTSPTSMPSGLIIHSDFSPICSSFLPLLSLTAPFVIFTVSPVLKPGIFPVCSFHATTLILPASSAIMKLPTFPCLALTVNSFTSKISITFPAVLAFLMPTISCFTLRTPFGSSFVFIPCSFAII